MSVNRRQFLQTAAATAGVGVFSSRAFAADPILVGSLHDLSGGLDIYGKPMVDALTLAIEEANAAGGLLGRQLKLISYDTQSSMQLYTQFAQQAALKDKVAVVHGGITSASREVIRPVLDKLQDPLLLQHAIRRRRLRPQSVRHGRNAGADGGEARSLRDEEVGQEGLCRSRPTTTTARSRRNG